ncbi:MAG: SGNH/GDSL hydrolase family protein [Thermodesulfobacteriota bacterium]
MKKYPQWVFFILKCLIAAIILLEVASFLAICLSNYWIYGQLRDGELVHYDPYALFLEGERPTFHNPPPGQEALTFWFFGGSSMRGATNHDDRTIPSFLAQIWNREEPELPAAMVNLGEDGFNSLMETKYLQKLLIDKKAPAVIVFFDGANDSAYFAQQRTPDAHQGYERVRGMIEDYHRSLFGLLKPLNAAMWSSFTREIYDKIRQGVIPIEPDSPELRQFVDSCEKRYDYLNKIAVSFGSKFLLIWQPCWWAETEPVAQQVRQVEDLILGKRSTLRHNFIVTYQALVGRLQGKPYFINFQNILCSRTEPVYQPDGIHLQDAGRKLVAQRLDQALKERILITDHLTTPRAWAAWGAQGVSPR